MTAMEIPDIIIGRRSVYLRVLRHMQSQGEQTTSSQALSAEVGVSAAQIRKDLSQFGGFRKQGTGFDLSFLIDRLCAILKVDRVWEVRAVGMGDIGRAIVHFQGFTNQGFRAGMVFDIDPARIGRQ